MLQDARIKEREQKAAEAARKAKVAKSDNQGDIAKSSRGRRNSKQKNLGKQISGHLLRAVSSSASFFEGIGKKVGGDLKQFGSHIARGLQLKMLNGKKNANQTSSAIEAMPSFVRAIPQLPVQRLRQYFTRYYLVCLIISGTELPAK